MLSLCKVCDQNFIENESEYKNYIDTLGKKDAKSKYKKHVINNIKLDEVDEILNEYVSFHNKKIDFYFVYCEFNIQFDNNSTTALRINFVHNTEIDKINQCFSYCFGYFESQGSKFHKINQMIIKHT